MKVKKNKEQKNFIWRKAVIVLFWLLVWQLAAFCIGNTILLEGPVAVFKRFLADLQTSDYYKTVGASVLRIMGGLFCGILFAVFLGILSWKKRLVEEMLAPLVQFLKAAPIACFVVLLLIWAGSKNLAFYIALLVAFPPIYFNLLEGLKQLDNSLLEVARVYHMPWKNRMRYIYLPEIKPYFISALSLAVGTAFKAGVAAEIIGTPDYSMGERIYMSKIYLDTAGVLSWMISVIFVAYLCEKICVRLATLYFDKRPRISTNSKNNKRYLVENIQSKSLKLTDCTISFDKEIILDHISLEFEAGKIYGITGKSGAGKTTFFNTLWGLKKPKDGNISGREEIKAGVFQENRLFEEYTAIENVFATGQCSLTVKAVEEAFLELLPKESLSKPVKEYSGGMKRRVEIMRAMLSDSAILLLDEPFNGLDGETKEKTIEFIKKYQKGRTILFTTHCNEDIENVKAEEKKLWKKE